MFIKDILDLKPDNMLINDFVSFNTRIFKNNKNIFDGSVANLFNDDLSEILNAEILGLSVENNTISIDI
jgi:hypothetical protein